MTSDIIVTLTLGVGTISCAPQTFSLCSILLHTKFQGYQSIGSGEEDFLRFLPYMGMVAMLVI